MLELNFSTFPVISTERLLLRDVQEADAEEILFMRSDKRVMEFLDRPPAKNIDEALVWIQNISNAFVSNEGINWAITIKGQPKLIGTIGFWRVDKPNYRAEIGYSLHPDFQGKGIMQEALPHALNFAFKEMNLHSIEANVNPSNKKSINFLERNNFRKEAYFKENYYFDGKFLDSVIYSMLVSDFVASV